MIMNYKRFRVWQENPFRYTMNEEELHRCTNCIYINRPAAHQ